MAYPIAERRERGRPKRTKPYETLHIRVSVELFDRVARLALRADKPVTVAARTLLEQQVSRMESVMDQG
jgi:predicted DNA-binding protein